MKKLVPLVLVLVLLLVATSAVSADPPPGIAPAFRTEGELCGVTQVPDWEYWGTWWRQYSNGATGHNTYKCKLELTAGTPQYSYEEFPADWFCPGGYLTLELEGKKGMWTVQCYGEWFP